jgi:hypothetical protein
MVMTSYNGFLYFSQRWTGVKVWVGAELVGFGIRFRGNYPFT